MNFPFFHQVIVAGGRDPLLLHTSMTDLDTDNGSSGLSSRTVVGSTRKKITSLKLGVLVLIIILACSLKFIILIEFGNLYVTDFLRIK